MVDRIEKLLRFKKKKSQLYQFPNNFLWGAATSSYQVEGGITGCDWHEWEPGHIENGDRAGRACNHFELYEKDFDLAKSLNHNAHRFSLEWSRIEPEEGKWDEGVLEHYRKVLVSLRERGLEPMVTLHHFTNPSWLSKYGFWDSPEIVRLYTRYVKKVAETLLPHARYWITLNEPILVVYMGYLEGLWPPGKAKWKDAVEALRNILRAHVSAYHMLHQESRKQKTEILVGIAKHMRAYDPYFFSNPLDLFACGLRNYFLNHILLDVLHTGILLPPLAFFKRMPEAKGAQDFIGINYYTRDHIAFDHKLPQSLFGKEKMRKHIETTDMNWEIYPRGLYRMLKYVKRFNLPVIITENGIATGNDEVRNKYIQSHLREVVHAIKDGVKVRGYFHWSLMDNFEWLQGFRPRFGLIGIDYKTLERKIKPSAEIYREICKTGRVSI